MLKENAGLSSANSRRQLLFLCLTVFGLSIFPGCSSNDSSSSPSPPVQLADLRASTNAAFRLGDSGHIAGVQDVGGQSQIEIDGVVVATTQDAVGSIQMNTLGQAVWLTSNDNTSKLYFYDNGATRQIADSFAAVHSPSINNRGQIVLLAQNVDEQTNQVLLFENGNIVRLTGTVSTYTAPQTSKGWNSTRKVTRAAAITFVA